MMGGSLTLSRRPVQALPWKCLARSKDLRSCRSSIRRGREPPQE
jgi:hypothetical protein